MSIRRGVVSIRRGVVSIRRGVVSIRKVTHFRWKSCLLETCSRFSVESVERYQVHTSSALESCWLLKVISLCK